MKYFFIYSAGGGAGDWNGLKRVWSTQMPVILKQRILLKFGDVFFNHAPGNSLVKPLLWKKITNIRDWLYQAVDDDFVNSKSKILLDSGTSKIVNHITTNFSQLSPEKIIDKFIELEKKYKLLERYVSTILISKVDEAVTFDIPNPFKIRTQSENTITKVFNIEHNQNQIRASADYANKTYSLLGNSQDKILTTINGQWNHEELKLFLSLLKYRPDKLAIGGLTRIGRKMRGLILEINKQLPLKNLKRIHFLGCGGIKSAQSIINTNLTSDSFSVDNSTPWNRAIDGNTSGTAFSGYFDYKTKKLYRIKPDTINAIFKLHTETLKPLFSVDQMKSILNLILLHQSGKSSEKTYEARALLALHNHDVFRLNAEKSNSRAIHSF